MKKQAQLTIQGGPGNRVGSRNKVGPGNVVGPRNKVGPPTGIYIYIIYVYVYMCVYIYIAYYLLPIAYCLLPIDYCLLPIDYGLLPAGYCLLPIACTLHRGKIGYTGNVRFTGWLEAAVGRRVPSAPQGNRQGSIIVL